MKSDESISLLREYKVPPAESRRIDWLHDQSTFDRLAAKQLIESVKNGPRNGMFVARHSSKNAKNYALTLYNDNEFFNYEIIHLNDTTYYIDDGPYFESLDHLIDHYCRIPDGLPTTLICSLNRFGLVVNSRVQPFSLSSVNNKLKGNLIRKIFLINKRNSIHIRSLDASIPVKPTLNRLISNDESTSNPKITQPTSLTRRPTFSSALSGSVTSLNSSSSRSRASSTQEDPLSTSSSSASLSSNSLSQHQTIPLVNDQNPTTNAVPFVDRRKSVGGKIKPFVPDFSNDNDRRSVKLSNGKLSTTAKRLTTPFVTVHKRKSLQLTFISTSQIKQTAKLGKIQFI